MTELSRETAAFGLFVLMAAVAPAFAQKPGEPRVNPDAAILQDFNKRVDTYMDLHKRLEKDVPPMKETDDPAKIKASQQALAAAIRRARSDARQGEIFTPEVAAAFRRLMYPEVKGPEGKETRSVMKEDPPGPVRFKVNALYPETSLPTVPPNILTNLPKLPEDLEYRVVGKHLILRDVHANVIVDFIPNAIR